MYLQHRFWMWQLLPLVYFDIRLKQRKMLYLVQSCAETQSLIVTGYIMKGQCDSMSSEQRDSTVTFIKKKKVQCLI